MAPDTLETWALALAIVGAAGCDDTPATDLAEERGSTAEGPIGSGCRLLDDARRCQLAGDTLSLWFPDVEPSWRWTLDGDATQASIQSADNGVRFSFDASIFEGEAHTLVLWDPRDDTQRFGLVLVPDPLGLNNFGFGDEVQAAFENPSPQDDRRRVANTLLAGTSASKVEEVARVHYARLLNYDRRNPTGSEESTLALLHQEDRLAAEHGLWGVRCDAGLVALSRGMVLERPDLTRRGSELEAQCRWRSAALGARFDHYLGRQALLQGAYAEAEARFLSLSSVAARVLPARDRIEASSDLMDLYVRTGRSSEAKRELESLESLPLGDCERAALGAHTGFVRVRERQGGEGDLGDPRPGLEAALRAHAQGPCKNAFLFTHDLVKLGYDAVLRDDVSALRGYVDRLSEERPVGKYRWQVAELKMELAVAEERYSELPALASAMDALLEDGEPEAQWRRHMILAKAAVAQGDNRAAEEAFVAAEAVLDTLWAGVSSDAVRARWLAVYRQSALGLLRVRLNAGDLEGAACAARLARRRALDLPGETDAVESSCERTWARGGGEAVFLIVPETDDDWYVFLIVEERVVEAKLVPAPTSEQDAHWWDPWTVALRSAARVRVLASGAALRFPLHQLAWRDEALIRQRPVTFGLDLDPKGSRKSPASPSAVVVFADVDPYRSLGRYAPDIHDLNGALDDAGWSPRWLETSHSTQTLSEAVTDGGLLVYYGHGERVEATGSATLSNANDVGSTALLMSRDVYWGVEDVSSLNRVPRWAVLLGCDVGFPDGRSWAGGQNLAHAFLLSGTSEVLAATGPVDAALAAEVGEPLLATDASPGFRLSDALHRVWAGTRTSETAAPIGALRVWSR